jgi:hypothetical protein
MRAELRRDAIVFALALFAHVGAFSAIRSVRPRDPQVQNAGLSPAEPVQEVAIDLEAAAASPVGIVDEATATTARSEPRSGRGNPGRATRSEEADVSAAPVPLASGEGPALLFTVPSLGLEGTNRFSTAGSAGPAERSNAPFANAAPRVPSSAEAAVAATKTLRDGLRDRDHDVGLGAEGPLLTSLVEATHESLAAERGRATFLAIVDTRGLVELRLLRSVGDGWDDARKRAARALAKKAIPLRGAARAELEIEVVSDVRLPSGAKGPVTPVLEESHVARTENVPGGTPDVVRTHTVARFDLADVGAKGTRVVHTRLVRASFF